MFSLQIQIRKLINRNQNDYLTDKICPLTIRFGSIQTDLQLVDGVGGKKLLLQMETQQMQNMLITYAFGLFFKNQNGKYFSVLSLQKLEINSTQNHHEIYFFNDDRTICFQSELSINLNSYHPKVPKKVPHHQVDHNLQHKTKISSFLYGNSKNTNSKEKIKQSKPPIMPPQKPKKQEVKIASRNFQESSNLKNKIRPSSALDLQESDGLFVPPVMQFTNQIEQQQPLHVPKIQMIHKLPQEPQKKFIKKQNNFTQVNQVQNIVKEKQIERKKKISISREELREEARRQAQKQAKNQENIMIPVPRGNAYELVPLSNLSQGEIIEYAHQQKLLEEQKRKQKQLKRELEEQKNKAKMKEMKKAPELPQRKKSNEQKHQIKPTIIQQSEPDDVDYQSDFDSISLGNSLIRSRHSLKSSNYMSSNKKADQSENIFESGYSQDFDSYSHSMLSHKKRANSISEISESMISISQSYKK